LSKKKKKKKKDKHKQKAEVHAYFGQYDLSEKLYMEMDRKNLAIDLRIRLGDWFQVVQLIKSGGGGDDILLEKAWDAIGDYYTDRREWTQAANYYQLSRNHAKLVDCYYFTEDYEKLEKLISSIQDGNMLMRVSGCFFRFGKPMIH
jgi:WD repeat-containing protein 35